MKAYQYNSSERIISTPLEKIYDVQVDKENNNRWFIAHGSYISYAYTDDDEYTLSGITRMVRQIQFMGIILLSNSLK